MNSQQSIFFLLKIQETGHQSPHDLPVAAKRKVKSNSTIETGMGMGGLLGQQMAMAAQHGLTAQQLQQFLQQQTTPAINPTQLQQLMQHQSMVMQHQVGFIYNSISIYKM